MPPTFPDRRRDDATLDDWFAEGGEVEWGGERDAGPARPRTELPRIERAAPTDVPVREDGSQRRAVVRRRRVLAVVALLAVAVAGVAAGIVLLDSDEPEAPTTTAALTTEPAATEPPPPPAPPATTTQPPAETTTPLTIELPEETASLAVGARGDEVETLQTALRALGFDPGAGDGVFGEATREAVREFQRANDLPADGIVGATTAEKLNAVLAEEGVTG